MGRSIFMMVMSFLGWVKFHLLSCTVYIRTVYCMASLSYHSFRNMVQNKIWISYWFVKSPSIDSTISSCPRRGCLASVITNKGKQWKPFPLDSIKGMQAAHEGHDHWPRHLLSLDTLVFLPTQQWPWDRAPKKATRVTKTLHYFFWQALKLHKIHPSGNPENFCTCSPFTAIVLNLVDTLLKEAHSN